MRWYYGWNVVAISVALQAISIGVIFFAFGVLLVPWTEEFQVSRAAILAGLTGVLFAQGLLAPFAGRLMGRFRMQHVVPIGMVLLASGFLLLAQVRTHAQFLAVFVGVLPLGYVLTGVLPAQTLTAQWFVRRRGLAAAVTSLGSTVGGLVAPLAILTLTATIGWRATFQCIAILELALLPVVVAIHRRVPSAADLTAEARTTAAVPVAAVADEEYHWTFRQLLASRAFWLTAVGALVVNGTYSSYQQNLAPHMLDLGYEATRAAVLLSLTPLAALGGKFVFGALCDRAQDRFIYLALGTLLVMALLVLLTSQGIVALTASAVLVGFGIGGMAPLLTTMIGSRFGRSNFSRVYGAAMPITTANAFAPTLAAWIRDETGSYAPAFVALVVLLLGLMGCVWLFLPRAGLTARGP